MTAKVAFSIAVTLVALSLSSCTTPSGWKVRFADGVYRFAQADYSINSPIPIGMCLDIKEFDRPPHKGAQFRECHGYIYAVYVASLITATRELDETAFIDTTTNQHIPAYLNNIFQPHAKAQLVSKEVGSVNGYPAVFFSGVADLPDGKARVISASVLLDKKTVLSASATSSLEEERYKHAMHSSPDAVEKEFGKFVHSVRKVAQP